MTSKHYKKEKCYFTISFQCISVYHIQYIYVYNTTQCTASSLFISIRNSTNCIYIAESKYLLYKTQNTKSKCTRSMKNKIMNQVGNNNQETKPTEIRRQR